MNNPYLPSDWTICETRTQISAYTLHAYTTWGLRLFELEHTWYSVATKCQQWNIIVLYMFWNKKKLVNNDTKKGQVDSITVTVLIRLAYRLLYW